MTKTYKMLVDGRMTAGVSSFDVINPATGEVLTQCPKADLAILDEAVAAARRAFPAWSSRSIEDRAILLTKIADAIEARSADFARLLTQEQGKPLDQAMGEIVRTAYMLRAFAAMRLEPKVLREEGANKLIEHRTPLGVIAAITPWNFPMLLLMSKLGPALISGNTVVAKPAPTTPLTTLLLGELCAEFLPAGVLNIICDENDLGASLTGHPDIAKVAFTGSTATGKKVMASAASAIRRVTLELGGNDAAIILDDVDPVAVAASVFQGAMNNAGQICVAIKRAYVPESLHEPFCAELSRLANAAIVDDGLKQGTQIGPVQNKTQFDRVNALIDDAREKGPIIAGGKPLNRPGYFIAPTIVDQLPESARLVQEEQFGPVLPVLSYTDIDDVVARANDSEYGLAASVWGKDMDRAMAVAMRIDAGTVWVNQHFAIHPLIPFRGAKQSGLGTELGEEGLLEYTQPHIVSAVAL